MNSCAALQVQSVLSGKDWLWVGDKFLGSSRVAFEVPAAASSILSSVSGALCWLATRRVSDALWRSQRQWRLGSMF